MANLLLVAVAPTTKLLRRGPGRKFSLLAFSQCAFLSAFFVRICRAGIPFIWSQRETEADAEGKTYYASLPPLEVSSLSFSFSSLVFHFLFPHPYGSLLLEMFTLENKKHFRAWGIGKRNERKHPSMSDDEARAEGRGRVDLT